jgi:protein TonB
LSILDAPPARRRRGRAVASAGALAVHAGLVLLATSPGARVVGRAADVPTVVTQMVEVDLPPPPLPPAVGRHVPPPPRAAPRAAASPPQPPAAAQAAQVLAAAVDDVVDLSDSVVVGAGPGYAGGVTQAAGTATAGARAGGVEGGRGTGAAGDRSRPPRLAGAAEWDCPFPEEADDAQIDHAVVTLRIEIGADGGVLDVRVTADPGAGFGREARRCALSKPWAPGLDRAGNPTAATSVVNVRFDRG